MTITSFIQRPVLTYFTLAYPRSESDIELGY